MAATEIAAAWGAGVYGPDSDLNQVPALPGQTPSFKDTMQNVGALYDLREETKSFLQNAQDPTSGKAILTDVHTSKANGDNSGAHGNYRGFRDDIVLQLGHKINERKGTDIDDDDMDDILDDAFDAGADAMADVQSENWEVQMAAFDKAVINLITDRTGADITTAELDTWMGTAAKDMMIFYETGDRIGDMDRFLDKFSEAAVENGDVIKFATWDLAEQAFDSTSYLHDVNDTSKMFLANLSQNMLKDVVETTAKGDEDGEYANYEKIRNDVVAQLNITLRKIHPELAELGYMELKNILDDALEEAAEEIKDMEENIVEPFYEKFAEELSSKIEDATGVAPGISSDDIKTIMGDNTSLFLTMYELGNELSSKKKGFFGGFFGTIGGIVSGLFSGDIGRMAGSVGSIAAAVSTGGASLAVQSVANGLAAETGVEEIGTAASVIGAGFTGGASLASIGTSVGAYAASEIAEEVIGGPVGAAVGNVAGTAINGGDIAQAAIKNAGYIAFDAIG